MIRLTSRLRGIRRKTSLLTAFATLLSGFGLVLLAQGPAEAHGVAMSPGSRTYLCYKDAITGSGAASPTNAACAAALAQSGSSSLYNWFAVLDSNAGGRGSGYVPDGTICSAGDRSPYDFKGYNLARNDWPKTHLTSGSSFQFKYSNWAAHPGEFRVYITRQGWSPTSQLKWSDLSLIHTVSNPPQTGSAGADGGYYSWNTPLPSGRSGDAMIFVQWVRSDSNENFFSCSDVVFDGGNGNVTGIGGSTQPSQPPTTTPPTTTPPTTTPPTTPPTSPSPSSCMASYKVVSSWGGGFQGEVQVMNHGTTALKGWRVNWTNASGTSVASLWNGNLTTSGSAVTVTNAAHNGAVAANGTTTFGFTANSSGSNLPTGSVSCTAL
ncbi:lytic polysaccharide monooxygenase [Streptomyces sp. NPDC056600]|uniref:lytic polysaccharide monooxygenase n=1 Tax=Streptomyces sp. NPDC056600 TaxID=3345874 RepID=UPI0036B2D4A4